MTETTEIDPAIVRWAESLTPQPLRRRGNRRSRAIDDLRSAIADGLLPPGTQMPEQVVADALGMSRNTLREAFRELSNDGLLEHRDNRGVVIRTLRADDVVDIYNTRVLIECGALAQAEHATPAQLGVIRGAVQAGLEALPDRDPQLLRRSGLAFHLGIVALAQSRALNAFADRLFTQLQLAYHQTDDPAEFHVTYIKRNADIYALLDEGRRTDAADEMRTYLRDAQSHLLTAITTHN